MAETSPPTLITGASGGIGEALAVSSRFAPPAVLVAMTRQLYG